MCLSFFPTCSLSLSLSVSSALMFATCFFSFLVSVPIFRCGFCCHHVFSVFLSTSPQRHRCWNVRDNRCGWRCDGVHSFHADPSTIHERPYLLLVCCLLDLLHTVEQSRHYCHICRWVNMDHGEISLSFDEDLHSPSNE